MFGMGMMMALSGLGASGVERVRGFDGAARRALLHYPVVMPLYEYACRSCDHRFELLVRESTTLACPSCRSGDLEKQLSVFAVGADGPKFAPRAAAPGACGSCGDPRGPGSCSMN
jgi:putative FmdB family regulatory protein